MAFYVHTKTHTHKQKLDHEIYLCGQGNKVTLIKNRNRTYAKKNCQTIQKQRTEDKEVEQEVRNNLSITLLSQTPLLSPGKMMTCKYILHTWVFSTPRVWSVGD